MTIPTLLAAATPFVDLNSGSAATMAGVTLSIARRYFVLAVVLGFLLEAFGVSPTGKRDYAACTWRAVVVLILLAFYPSIFGSVVNLASDVAAQVTPPSVFEQLGTQFRDSLKTSYARPTSAAASTGATPSGGIASPTDLALRVTGGLLFDSIIALLATVALAITWLVTVLAAMLVTLFYILGPLALVFAVPRMSDTGSRWFTELITFCSWPIFSGLLLQIVVSFGSHVVFGTGSGPVTAVASALLMTACAIATPVLASRLVGGSVKSAAAHGAQTAASFAKKSASLYKSAFAGARVAAGDPTAVAATAAVAAAPTNAPGGN